MREIKSGYGRSGVAGYKLLLALGIYSIVVAGPGVWGLRGVRAEPEAGAAPVLAAKGTAIPANEGSKAVPAMAFKVQEVQELVVKVGGDEREVPIRVTYPVGAGPFGVIVLCHGALGSKDGYQPLADHWAGNGFVVIRPTFGDSLGLMPAAEREQYKSVGELVSSKYVVSQWRQRAVDVSHVIDKLGWIGEQIPALKGKMDAQKLAVVGHSFGAHTTMLLAGMELKVGFSRTVQMPDTRVKAFVAISPPGTGAAVKAESFAKIRKPVLMITGDNDGSPLPGMEKQKGLWRKEAFDNSAKGDRYLLWIDGAQHNFGGIAGAGQRWAGAGPDDKKQVQVVAQETLDFLKQFVLDQKVTPDFRSINSKGYPVSEGVRVARKSE
jgi:predicted dienelactone hydrolase